MLEQAMNTNTVIPFQSPRERSGVKVFKGDSAIQGLGHWSPSEIQKISQLSKGIVTKNNESIASEITNKTGVSEVRVVNSKTIGI